jgi:Ca-activated chloride channel family protein
MGVLAAEQIARGDIKAEGWLAPSTSLVNYANHSVRNLGARQRDCQTIFSTPVVIATREKNSSDFNASGQSFSWAELLEKEEQHRLKDSQADSQLSFSHGTPRSSTTGLPALLQLSLLSLPGKTQTLSLEALRQPETISQLRKFQSFVSDYSLSEGYLLGRSARFESRRVRSTITTEQQVALFNSSRPAGADKLLALYPSEGSAWDDYQFCVSDADWVTIPHRAALGVFGAFLRETAAQQAARQQGFRPSQPTDEIAPLLPEFGVNLALPERSFLPTSGESVAHLLSAWPEFVRPAAIALVLDSSGSMEGDPIERAKEQFRNLLGRTGPRDLKMLITFATRPTIVSDFTTDIHRLLPALDQTQPVGGSAVYDAVRAAIEAITKNEILHSYRRQIIVITDGDDKNSEGSLQGTVDLVKDKLARNDIKLTIIGIRRDGANYDDLRRIAENGNGYFFESEVPRLPDLFQEIAQSIQGTTP